MSQWVKRPYVAATDEGFVLGQWLSSWAHAPDFAQHGALRLGSPQRDEYWRRTAPVVEAYLEIGNTEVICAPGDPNTLVAFACTNDEHVHYVSVKRKYKLDGYSVEMVRDLLGARLDDGVRCWYTCELVEISAHVPRGTALRKNSATCGVSVPTRWRPDPHFLARMSRGGVRAEREAAA